MDTVELVVEAAVELMLMITASADATAAATTAVAGDYHFLFLNFFCYSVFPVSCQVITIGVLGTGVAKGAN